MAHGFLSINILMVALPYESNLCLDYDIGILPII